MSLIIQDSGMLTLLQTLDPEVSARGNEYNGACDRLAHQLANQLVGNSPEQPTIEMTLRPGAIKFTEPTIVAFSGAEFKAKSGDRDIFINRIYLFDRGDELIFGESTRGNRVYLAVAGGIKVEGSNVLRSGDEVIMCRDYTPQHDELFNMLKQQKDDFGFLPYVAPRVRARAGAYTPYDDVEICGLVNSVKEAAGLPSELTAMDLRRTAITQMVERGVDVVGIMQVINQLWKKPLKFQKKIMLA